MNIVDLQNLVPGSQWQTPKGHVHTFMFHTNEALPKKLVAKYPSVLVYVDERGNVLSTRTEAFLKIRTFRGLDERRAQLLESLVFNTELPVHIVAEDGEEQEETDDTIDSQIEVVDSDNDEDEEEDDGSLSGEEEDGDLEEDQQVANSEQWSDDQPRVKVLFYSEESGVYDGLGPNPISEEQLRQAFLKYTAAPGYDRQGNYVLKHEFLFDTDVLTSEQIAEAFNTDFATYFSEFEVDGTPITWDSFHGVYQTTDNFTSSAIAVFESRNSEEEEVTHPQEQPDVDDSIPSADLEVDVKPLIDPNVLAQTSNVTFMKTVEQQNKTVPLTPEQVQAIQDKQTDN